MLITFVASSDAYGLIATFPFLDAQILPKNYIHAKYFSVNLDS